MPRPAVTPTGGSVTPSSAPGRGLEVDTTARRLAHTSPVLCLSLSPNLKTLASADAKGNVLLWPIGPAHTNFDLSESAPLPLTGHVKSVTGLGFLHVSKQLRLFTASTDRTLRVRARAPATPMGVCRMARLALTRHPLGCCWYALACSCGTQAPRTPR